MDKYAQLNRLHHDRQLQVYMYYFMYVDPQKIPVKETFVATLNVSVNYKKMSIPGTVPKHQLIFSYIRTEDYVTKYKLMFWDCSLPSSLSRDRKSVVLYPPK